MQTFAAPRFFSYLLICGYTAIAFTAGCRPEAEKLTLDVQPKNELSFAEQAADVRMGNSQQIRLDHRHVSDADLDQLDGLEGKLLRLNLSHTDISDAGLERIAAVTQLELLRLASPRITSAGLATLQRLPNLKHLHLIGAPLTDEDLPRLYPLKSLRSLYLDDTQATDAGMAELTAALPDVHLHIDGGHHRLDPRPLHPH